MWHVYIWDRQGRLYTGITTDLEHRMKQHGAELLYSEPYGDKHSAARREREIKGWRREKKLALLREQKVSLPWVKRMEPCPGSHFDAKGAAFPRMPAHFLLKAWGYSD